jgi:hypothetical protein
MTKFFAAALLIALTASLVPATAADGTRHREPAGGFSIVPPADWKVQEFPGLKYKLFMKHDRVEFAPNICIVDENSDLPFPEYISENVKVLKLLRYKVVDRPTKITTDAGECQRIRYAKVIDGHNLRFTAYCFARGDTKFVVTFTRLADDADAKVDALVEASVKTMQFDPAE